MKYVVIIGDGMADLMKKGHKTPLQTALTPNMDRLAREGTVGMVKTVPAGLYPGSDVANLSILGYDPRKYYTGRAPFEAASIGVKLDKNDVAYRCNLVTLGWNPQKTKALMNDYSAGHITTDEARSLIEALGKGLGGKDIAFHAGVSYRHLMVWHKGESRCECTAPHDITGREITDYLPLGHGAETLKGLMQRSVGILEKHEVNAKRISAGKNPANSIWLWGQGRKPSMPSFREKYALSAAMVSAVDLTKGIGIYLGMEILDVPGVTGYLDTNYLGKAEYSLKALERVDLVYIHVEAPDEAGHSGNLKDKIRAIEDFDALVVGTVLRGIKAFGEYRVLLLPDHPTPVELKTHTADPVPFVIFDSRSKRATGPRVNLAPVSFFDESIAERNDAVVIEEGHRLMDFFLTGHGPERTGHGLERNRQTT